MFIGDSTMMQAGAAVINAVHWDNLERHGVDRLGNRLHRGCQEQLSFGQSDTLIGVGLGRANRGRTWVELANRTHATGASARPDIVVVSAGPHVYLLPDFDLMLDRVVEEHRALFPEVKLVWKTQPGVGCGLSPLKAPPDAAFWGAGGPSYNHALFPAFDAAAHTLFAHPAAARDTRFLLDVSPLALRVDSHPGSRGAIESRGTRDCLHSCPGPLDHLVPRNLLHLLLHHGL